MAAGERLTIRWALAVTPSGVVATIYVRAGSGPWEMVQVPFDVEIVRQAEQLARKKGSSR